MPQHPSPEPSITLRPLTLADLELFHEWLSDYDVVRYSLSQFLRPATLVERRTWLQGVIDDQQTLSLGIVRQDTGRLIGYAGICSISRANRSGEFFILIGDKASWGHGYGTAATRLIRDIGFTKLRLHRIQLTVSAPNHGALKAYERAGFTVEGTLQDACYRDGSYHDKVMMAAINPEP